TLEAVWAAPGGVVAWAVGPGGIAVRRDAGVWSIVPVPTTQSLTGVWGASAADVWAVTSGDLTDGGAILHWDGAVWSVSFREMAGGFASVSGAAANDVSVVGSGHEPDGDYASLILHWDGAAWTESYTCNPQNSRFAGGGFVSSLFDVWSVAGGSVWAVGQCFPPTDQVGFVTRAGVYQGALGLAPLLDFRSLDAVWASADTDVWIGSLGAPCTTSSPPCCTSTGPAGRRRPTRTRRGSMISAEAAPRTSGRSALPVSACISTGRRGRPVRDP